MNKTTETSSSTPETTSRPSATKLDLYSCPIELTRQLVDVESVSHNEKHLADLVEEALNELANRLEPGTLTVDRYDNNVIARTHLGLTTRVILAGHLDTVPIADNVPSVRKRDDEGNDAIFGCGSVDMKSGDAVFLHLLAKLSTAGSLTRDVTAIFYEAEEVAARYNGIAHLSKAHPEWLKGDVAILGEPSGGVIEGGCQGSIRIKVTGHGVRAHSARSWLGSNAFHALVPVMDNIVAYTPRTVVIDGLTYREGLNITWAECGVATNTIPDTAWFFVNFRFAPDHSEKEAYDHLMCLLGHGDDPHITFETDDSCPGALPGLDHPVAAELVAAAGGQARAKYGWTDVARFAQLGIPAVNFGPGDPSQCHTPNEHCPVSMITDTTAALETYLTQAQRG